MATYHFNPVRVASPQWSDQVTDPFDDQDICDLHRSIPEYKPTPLLFLPNLAAKIGVKNIMVKDESKRFGLRAFKALGGAYAIYRWVCQQTDKSGQSKPLAKNFYSVSDYLKEGQYTFCTATDGNHGRGVAWAARKLRQRAVIFMPAGSSPTRVELIHREGAQVIVTDGNYDAAVTEAARSAETNGWQIISDTSWEGYDEIPRWISAGYKTLFEEISDESKNAPSPDIIIVPSGVGALAATAAYYYHASSAKLVSVEPDGSACCLESIMSPDQTIRSIHELPKTIMAGLHCGTPSTVAWPFIRDRFDLFMSLSDNECRSAGKRYRTPIHQDPIIDSGPSGSASLAGLLALTTPEGFTTANKLGIGSESTVVVINTEGDLVPSDW